MKRRLLAVLMVAILLIPMLSGCKKEAGLTKITLNEVAHSVFYAPQYVALELGYFKEEGLDVELVTGFGADKTMTAVLYILRESIRINLMLSLFFMKLFLLILIISKKVYFPKASSYSCCKKMVIMKGNKMNRADGAYVAVKDMEGRDTLRIYSNIYKVNIFLTFIGEDNHVEKIITQVLKESYINRQKKNKKEENLEKRK